MIELPALAWRWSPVAEAPAPRAAVGHGPAASRLLARLRALPAQRRALLTATAAADWLVVLGPADELPWAEGVRYAAPCPSCPALWLPTHCRPDVASDLLGRALERHHGRSPLLLWPDPAAALPLDRQLPADDALVATLARRLQAAGAPA
ncbi:MAG: hypothetical protein ABJD97_07945 [Betaproteobacteria bacterium]